jgi:methyl-accepting chemotaxis protein
MNELKEENNRSYAAYEATRSNAEETALYEKVKVEKAKFRDDMEAIRKLSRINTPATNKQALDKIDNELRPELTVYAAAMHNLIAYDMKGCQDGLGLIDGAVGAARIGVLAGLAVSVALAIPIVLFVVRSITRPVGEAVEAIEKLAGCDLTVVLDNDSGDEIGQMARSLNAAIEKLRTTLEQVTASAQSASSSSQELSSAAETLASGAQEQASSLEETSASLEQITATVRQSADNARQASQIASSSRESAERGQDVVTSAVHAMEEINTASAKISDIISTIDEIAFQTNLLAVNAAVEAARAGEEGRGFAVVASEVRSLAQRSAGAAKEIKALIQDSLRKVEKGSELVNRSGETLLSIVGSVKKVTDIVGEIAAAAEEQSTGVDQVNTAVTQIDQVTQQNSAQTEELSSTAQTLSDQSARLLKLVSVFTLSEGGFDAVAQIEPQRKRPAKQLPRPASRLASSTKKAYKPKMNHTEVPAALLAADSHSAGAADSSFEEF